MLDPITEKRNRERPAVRRGDLYCANWCGCGCTWAAYVRATEEGDALARRLGVGWRTHVWENGGWHYEAIRGVVEVKPSLIGGSTKAGWKVGSYTAWIQTKPQFISSPRGTPEDALREAMVKMKTAFDALASSFNDTLEIGSSMGLIQKSV